MPLSTDPLLENTSAETYRAPVPYSKILERMIVAHKLPRTQPYPFIDKESTFSFYPKTTRQDQIISSVMESCLFKSCLSTVAGYGLGGLVGLFTFGVESPQHHQDPSRIPTVKETMREMKTRLHSQGKAFAFIGGMFSITECAIETYRGKSDSINSPAAGFITGGLLGLRLGLKAGLYGGLGFGAFSLLIDYYFFHRR